MADQRLGVDAGKLFLADREGDDGMSVALMPWLPSSL